VVFYEGAEAHLDSNFIQNISNRQLCHPAHGRDRYPGSDGGVMLGFSRNFARSCGGRWRGELRTLRPQAARFERDADSIRRIADEIGLMLRRRASRRSK
jgi:hypothetical protein